MSRRALALSLPLVLALAGTAAAAVPAPGVAPSTATVASADAVAPQRVAAPVPSRSSARASLGSRLTRALSGSTARTLSAAVDVDGLGAVYRRDASHALPPASTRKSFVVSAALLALGPDARLRTEVAATATATAGVLPGALYLVAGGDPYLNSIGLRGLAQSVKAAGVTTVLGDLRLDDTRYDALRRNPGWSSSYVPKELGPLSAFALDRNASRRDAAYLRDPALPNAVRFRDLLRAEGVVVQGRVVRGTRPAVAATVAEKLSAPLVDVTSRLLKASDNFAAEMLLKEVGHKVRGSGSAASGVGAVRDVLVPLGVQVGAATDGSGLSSRDRQTTAGQLSLLRAVGRSGVSGALRASLPVACVDGTLRRRMCRTAAAGTVFAKTGTLSGVTSLAGFAVTRSGRPVRFAFQLTGVRSASNARAAIDRAVVALATATD